MIRFVYDEPLLAQPAAQALLTSTESYTAHLRDVAASGTYEADESTINLPGDTDLLAAVQNLTAEKANEQLKYHIVVGIGGSNLGTKAVYDALYGYCDVMESTRFPKLLFAETTDPEWLAAAVELVKQAGSSDEILVSVISKSGGTTETMANFEIVAGALREKFSDYRERIVAITDEGSALWEAAKAQDIATLAIPKKVGGRFSVFSAVGLFPLATVGVDIESLRQGALAAREESLTTDSPAAKSAALLEHYRREGKTINDNFMFHSELESLGKWYRQLMGESVGKKDSLDGELVHAGITPTVSLGSTDLHSVGQLYLGGPKDKFTTFVRSGESAVVRVPEERIFPDVNPMVSGRGAAEIMEAILEGVQIAYKKANLPYAEVILERIDEHSIGAFLQFKMIEMMYLGRLMNVNTFDQPSVESYKVETKQILEGREA